jgi:nucleoside phosphorylase
MRIACISAVKIEIEWLLSRLGSAQKHKIPGGRLWVGKIGSHRLGLFCCGVGPQKACRGMQSLSSVFPAERVYHLGVCGSLTDSLEPGTPVIARAVISSYAAEQQAVELDPPGAEDLENIAAETSPRLGLLLTHNRPVLSVEERMQLNSRYGADCVDMEAWEVACFCRSSGLPLTIIKAVSDTADSGAMIEFSRHSRWAANASCRLVQGLILRL